MRNASWIHHSLAKRRRILPRRTNGGGVVFSRVRKTRGWLSKLDRRLLDGKELRLPLHVFTALPPRTGAHDGIYSVSTEVRGSRFVCVVLFKARRVLRSSFNLDYAIRNGGVRTMQASLKPLGAETFEQGVQSQAGVFRVLPKRGTYIWAACRIGLEVALIVIFGVVASVSLASI